MDIKISTLEYQYLQVCNLNLSWSLSCLSQNWIFVTPVDFSVCSFYSTWYLWPQNRLTCNCHYFPKITIYFESIIHVGRHARLLPISHPGRAFNCFGAAAIYGSGGTCFLKKRQLSKSVTSGGVHEQEDDIYSSRDTFCIYCTKTPKLLGMCLFVFDFLCRLFSSDFSVLTHLGFSGWAHHSFPPAPLPSPYTPALPLQWAHLALIDIGGHRLGLCYSLPLHWWTCMVSWYWALLKSHDLVIFLCSLHKNLMILAQQYCTFQLFYNGQKVSCWDI